MFLEDRNMALVRATQIEPDLRVQLIIARSGFVWHPILLTGLARSRNILLVYQRSLGTTLWRIGICGLTI